MWLVSGSLLFKLVNNVHTHAHIMAVVMVNVCVRKVAMIFSSVSLAIRSVR